VEEARWVEDGPFATSSGVDPFSRFLNKGNAEEILRRMGRA
jgi:hypothetical protein